MTDQTPPLLSPPPVSEWPPDNTADGPARRTYPRWTKWCAGIAVVLIAFSFAGAVIRVPYDTFSPGGALNLESRISISGTKTYRDRGQVMLLFVRERSRIDLWRLLQAKLDPDTDIVKQVDVTGGSTQLQADRQDVCDMSQSQVSARVAALTALGYKVPVLPGLDIVGLPPTYQSDGRHGKPVSHKFPAAQVLQPCDQLVAADGHVLKQPGDLSKIVKAHGPGTSVVLRVVRAGREQTVPVPVVAALGTHLIGVDLALRYKIPVRINIDTNDIGGPSAGLAMTLAIIDALTPGDLTGGKRVATTGTIDPSGNVGEIGALEQKAVAARAAHAQIFIVPACVNPSGRAACKKDLAVAQKRVGNSVKLAPVSTLEQALAVLRAAGGSGVPAAPKAKA